MDYQSVNAGLSHCCLKQQDKLHLSSAAPYHSLIPLLYNVQFSMKSQNRKKTINVLYVVPSFLYIFQKLKH